MKKLFIFGFGYTAQNFVRQFENEFSEIVAYTRNKYVVENSKFSVMFLKESQIINQLLIDRFTHILISVPPDQEGDVFYINYKEFMKKLKKIKWIGYLSATNIYGDYKGNFVYESSKTNPSTQKGKNRLLAENQLLSFCKELNLPIHIFRIAGIYGPKRNLIKKIKEKTINNIYKKNQFFSRIYIDDLVMILKASMFKPNPFSIYNISDNLPSNITDVIEYICHQIKVSIPDKKNYMDDEIRNNNESFFSENKKINNELIKREFGYEFKYPSYIEGYKKLLED